MENYQISIYRNLLSRALNDKLIDINPKSFKTEEGDYEVIKIVGVDFRNDPFPKEIHKVFSPDGFEIKDFIVKAEAYKPHSDRNAYTSYVFIILTDSIKVRFDYELETFEIENVEIKYVRRA